MSKLGPISHFSSPVSCDALVLQGLRCEWGAGVLNLVLSLSFSHTGHWKFNMAPNGKELQHVGQDHTGQVPLRTDLAMVDQRT